MKINKEIHENIVSGWYLYLFAFIFLVIWNYFHPFSNLLVIVVVALAVLVVVVSNGKISPDNIGLIAILHIFSIVGMIGFYDYFSNHQDRLNMYLNFGVGFSGALTLYGIYFRVRDKK